MKRWEKILALALVIVLALGVSVPILAAADAVEFSDVDPNAWYAQAVAYCQERGWMGGTSETTFAPEETMTRAMLVTVLYRRAGSPAVTGGAQFADTEEGAWYADAVRWANETGLVTGYGNGLFGVADPVSREQLVTILWRGEGSPSTQAKADFTDRQAVSPWAEAAVDWAVEAQVMSGKTGNRFDPAGNATRAEVATVLRNAGETIWAEAPADSTPAPTSRPSRSGSSGGSGGGTPAPSPAPGGEETVQDDYALIRGGAFQMGSPADEPERDSDETQHSVRVSDFYMAKTEVTQRAYREVMGTNPSDAQGDDLPVTNLTWYDAIEYCNKLSQAAGLTPCYTLSGATVTWNRAANGYRLPTEAEWEFAARANTTTPFSFGDYVHNSDANCYNAYGYNNDASGNWVNGSDSYLSRTVEVTRYPANANGLYNVHGNVAEWVWDWYGPYATAAASDPTGPSGGNAKVVRGGGWNDQPKHIRSAYRGAQSADVGLYSIGVRPVRNAQAATGSVTSTYSAVAQEKTGKTLILYFSQTGNTQGLAELIHDMSGYDIFRLERATPYASSSNGPVLYGEALDELRAEATPELKAYPDVEQYDTILLGYCNWWASIPAPVRTFLTRTDLSGKTIAPFCSMGGGHFGQTLSAIAKLAPNSVIREGLEVTYSSYDREKIQAWLDGLDLDPTPAPTPTPTPEPAAGTLVAYFSATGNTQGVARHIQAVTGGDLFEIVPEMPYTAADLDYNSDCRANREQNDDSARPAIAQDSVVENMADYDVIFLGYPIWWGQAPKIIYTFLESYDLTGKTIVPFCTSGSSDIGASDDNLHPSAEGASWLDGRRFSAGADQASVQSWVDDLGLSD